LYPARVVWVREIEKVSKSIRVRSVSGSLSEEN